MSGTGCTAINPLEFPKFMADFCDHMSKEEVWQYGCLTGWRCAEAAPIEAGELPRWIDDAKGKDPFTDDLIAEIIRLRATKPESVTGASIPRPTQSGAEWAKELSAILPDTAPATDSIADDAEFKRLLDIYADDEQARLRTHNEICHHVDEYFDTRQNVAAPEGKGKASDAEDAELIRLSRVAIDECGDCLPQDWMVAAIRVCKAIAARAQQKDGAA